MGVLHIPKIPQYGVLIEKSDEIENSLFYEIYNDAANNVVDIIEGQKDSKNELFLNPCIAFVGKRGTGKSSAMCSFANLLDHDKSRTKEWIKNEYVKEKISKSKFYILPAIDTANMSKEETILSNVSSEMFKLFNSQSTSISVDNKRKFISSAMSVNNAAMLKSSGDWAKQGDKLLAETDKVVHLKSLFEEMVKNFLTIVENNLSENDCYIVIQLDDLDMNVLNSFAIMEEIRNLLSVKNVIILLSVDIEQLKTVLRINFSETLHSSKSESIERSASKISKDLSYKYIEKLLPVDRRHYMPEFTIDQLKIHKSKNFLGDNDENWYRMNLVSNKGDTPSILNSVMHLIWRKTMMIPMCNENKDYMLLPHNLRSLTNFIVFLRSMKDVALKNSSTDKNKIDTLTYFDFSDNEDYRNVLEHNLRDFNKYIINNLEIYKAPEMNSEDEKLADSLINIIQTFSDVSLDELNRKITSDIIYSIKDANNNYYQLLNKSHTIDHIYEASSYTDTISLGDVLYLLGKIERKTNCGYIRYLIEVIRTLWSIKMTNEIYVKGCNVEKSLDFDTQARFITTTFRNAIGAMIINPDTSESFLHSAKIKNHDWSLIENRETRTIYDVVISRKDKGIQNIFSDDCSMYKWRIHMRTGEPIYRVHYSKDEHYLVSHPMLLFSNLLYPELLYTDLKYNSKPKEEKVYSIWQKEYIMVFPFYSMDYMYRLYIAFRKNAKLFACSNQESIISKVLDNIIRSSESLYNEIKKYIPKIVFNCKTEIQDLLCGEDDYIFEAPLKKLLDSFSSNKDLLLVNKAHLIELKNFLDEVDTFQLPYNDEIIRHLTDKYANIIETISIYLNNKYLSESYAELTSSDKDLIDKIEGVRGLYNELDAKRSVIPYYYEEEIIKDETPLHLSKISTEEKTGEER